MKNALKLQQPTLPIPTNNRFTALYSPMEESEQHKSLQKSTTEIRRMHSARAKITFANNPEFTVEQIAAMGICH